MPGPGAYNAIQSDYAKNGPTTIIGSEKRAILRYKRATSPGPGAYEIPHKKDPRNASFGTSKRPEMVKNTQDPGFCYNPPSTFGAVPSYALN